MGGFFGHSGVCAKCQTFGFVWIGSSGQLCDDCHTRAVVKRNFATDPVLAQQVYASATADDALRKMGIRP
jgi:hypothetical protein